MSIKRLAQRAQGIDQYVPMRWRLPLRYTAQSLLGALEPEISLLPHFLGNSTGRTAIDIGANVGIYTYALHRLGLEVHAFEPQPDCAAVISAWAKHRSGITVHNSGLGSKEGHLLLHVPVVNGRPVSTRASFESSAPDDLPIRVPIMALDAIALHAIAFIKIDVEGYEFEVLRGASTTLDRFRPKLLIEIDRARHTRASFTQVIDFLTQRGYRCHIVQGDRNLPACPQPWDAPTHVCNFLFSM